MKMNDLSVTRARLQIAIGEQAAAALAVERNSAVDAICWLLLCFDGEEYAEPTERYRDRVIAVAKWLLYSGNTTDALPLLVAWNKARAPDKDPLASVRRWAD